MSPCIIQSRYRMLPVVALPICAVLALVGEVNPQPSVLHTEVQMEVFPTGLDSHPPVVVRHLLKVNEGTLGNDFIKRRSSVWQLALGPDLERRAVLLPGHAANLIMEYARPLRGSCRFRDGLSVPLETNMRDAEHFKEMYRAGEVPWDLGKPDANLIHTVTTTPIRPCKTLEIGCGTGDNAIWLAQQGFDVVAVDVSSIAIEQATAKAAQIGTKCDFLVLDVFQEHTEGGPFGFAFDRGFLHIIDSNETRQRFAERLSGYLDESGLWLSLLGNADGVSRGGQGPPQRSARDIVNAVEPYFEILSLASSHFESSFSQPPRAWVCLMRKRA